MTGISIGDMAQQFMSLRSGSTIKSELATLSQSLSSGKVDDLTAVLGGGTERFSALDYSLKQIGAYQTVAKETAQRLDNMQIVLSRVDDLRSISAERLLRVNDSSTGAQIEQAARESVGAFDEVVRALNTQIGDRALFGGARVDAAPLAAADDMMNALRLVIGGATDAPTIIALVDNWFDTPGGGFEMVGYFGDDGPAVQKQISETGTVAFDIRADDTALRSILKGTALAGLAATLPGIDIENKTALLTTAGQSLFAASTDLVDAQATLGFMEDKVGRTIAQNTAQETSLSMARNEITQADPFETATALQAVQLQLETHFAVTARMSQLSLLRYI